MLRHSFIALLAVLAGLCRTAPAQDNFRALTLSGRVLLEDGTPPPQPAVIELRCSGRREPQYYTNREGFFNFRVGGDITRSLTDPQRQTPNTPVGAAGSDRSFVSLTDCELEASLAGYTSSKINLGRRSVFESTDVGTLVLHPLAKGEGTFVSVNTLAAPPEAKKMYDRAEKEIAREKPDYGKAAKDLAKSVQAYPQFAAAWNLMGKARAGMQDVNGAREAFLKASAADPKFVPPMLSLSLLEMQQQHMSEAAGWAGKVLALLPSLPEAHFYNAAASLAMGNDAAAEKSARMVVAGADAQRYPRAYFILGNILARKGEIPDAAAQFRKFLELEPSSRAAEAVRKQLADWQAGGKLP